MSNSTHAMTWRNIAVLAVAVLIARQQHRRALRQQKRRQQRMNAGASPLDNIQTSA